MIQHIWRFLYPFSRHQRAIDVFDLDIESTHGQPASCRARPVNIDDHLENSMWTHGVGGERLPAVSYVLLKLAKVVVGNGFLG